MKKLNNKGFTLLEGLIIVFVLVLVIGLGFFAKSRMDNKSSSATSYTRLWTNQYNTTVSACNGYSDGRYYVRVYGTKSTRDTRNVVVTRPENGINHLLGNYHRWGNPATYFYSRSSSAGSVKFELNVGGVRRTIPFTSISAC